MMAHIADMVGRVLKCSKHLIKARHDHGGNPAVCKLLKGFGMIGSQQFIQFDLDPFFTDQAKAGSKRTDGIKCFFFN